MRHLLAGLSMIIAFAAHAAPEELQVGREYTVIDPPMAQTAPTGKVEVIEFFSYGCPHCKEFNPLVSAWSAKLPKDVAFRKVPITFGRPAWARLASIHYALETTGDLAKLEMAVFKALHDERINFNSDESIVSWAASKGADGKKIEAALSSFGLQSQIRRGDQESQAAKIAGVPAIVVGGRYMVNNNAIKNYEDLLRITDALIVKSRQDRGGK